VKDYIRSNTVPDILTIASHAARLYPTEYDVIDFTVLCDHSAKGKFITGVFRNYQYDYSS
jgi:hypothetical protein